jgi:serine/threonine protein kinase
LNQLALAGKAAQPLEDSCDCTHNVANSKLICSLIDSRCMQITLALQHMHARNMVHMDVKPDNIYIVDDTMYKLGDLGLATSSCSGNCNRIEEGDAR